MYVCRKLCARMIPLANSPSLVSKSRPVLEYSSRPIGNTRDGIVFKNPASDFRSSGSLIVATTSGGLFIAKYSGLAVTVGSSFPFTLM
jgi:hypothetical protein